MQIDINMDDVFINGQKVTRPSYVSRSEWLEFWEQVKRKHDCDCV